MSELNEIPRRAYVDKRTPLENEIAELIGKVEDLGADKLLTDVVDYLSNAFQALADWEDNRLHQQSTRHPGHKIVKCSECDEVIMQCKCIDKNKPVEYRICEDCFEKIGRGNGAKND